MFKFILVLAIALNPLAAMADSPKSLEVLQARANDYVQSAATAQHLAKSILSVPTELVNRTGLVLNVIVESPLTEGERVLKVKELETALNQEIASVLAQEKNQGAGRGVLGTVIGAAVGLILTTFTGNGGPFDVLNYIIVGPIFMLGGAAFGGLAGTIPGGGKSPVQDGREQITDVVRLACERILKSQP